MHDLFEIVNGLEAKISKLIKRQTELQEKYENLLQENKGLQQEVASRQRKVGYNAGRLLRLISDSIR